MPPKSAREREDEVAIVRYHLISLVGIEADEKGQ